MQHLNLISAKGISLTSLALWEPTQPWFPKGLLWFQEWQLWHGCKKITTCFSPLTCGLQSLNAEMKFIKFPWHFFKQWKANLYYKIQPKAFMSDFTPAWISALEGFENLLPMRESKEGAVHTVLKTPKGASQPGASLWKEEPARAVSLQIGSLVQQAKRGTQENCSCGELYIANSLGRPAPEYHPNSTPENQPPASPDQMRQMSTCIYNI